VGDDGAVTNPPDWAPIRVVTADGVRLSGLRCTSRAADPGSPAFVVAHGFTHGTAAPATRRVIAALARHGPVVALDFRGHGRSGGRSSVGRDETLDLDAAGRAARPLSSGPVAVVGFSMGAAVALRHAAVGADRGDAVVSVSAPSRWYIRHTSRMRRVHWLLEHPVGPLVGRALGVRLGEPWPEVPPTPLELVHRIPPLPMLLVHGAADRYFGTDEATALHRASGGAGPLWIEPGMGHAETATSTDLVDRIARWVASACEP
jgi:pimeloyl-ACP methyl ester carboxylesterase